ncbi:hypothetical protein HK097_007910, partial [Rhizophlyctis rosea]
GAQFGRVDETLAAVLPEGVIRAGPVAYYQHVLGTFKEWHVPEMVVHFARRALNEKPQDSEVVMNLQKTVFHGSLDLLAYDDAYAALAAMPDATSAKDCLHRFVTVCATNGELALLCERFAIASMQEEMENTLRFKARSGPVSVPGWGGDGGETNYFNVLWSYFVFKMDYKNASLAMYQYARSLNALTSSIGDERKLRAIVTEQARALLAAVNGLSLVEEGNRWILDESEVVGEERERKRRKIQHGPRVDPDAATKVANVRIVEPAELHQEYLLAVSKLHTANADRTNLQGAGVPNPSHAISMYLQAGMYDKALDLGTQFELDVGKVFERVAEKCVIWRKCEVEGRPYDDDVLTLTDDPPAGWEGSPSDRGWRLLESWLKKHDSKENGWRYWRCVVERCLIIDPEWEVPVWVKEFYKKHHPEDLLRVYVRFGAWERAAEFAVEYIKHHAPRSTGIAERPIWSGSRWLPYSLLDSILKGLSDGEVKREFKKVVEEWVVDAGRETRELPDR